MSDFSSKENCNTPRTDTCSLEKRDCPNYCVGGILSRCGAGAEWQKQKKCRYYQKSTVRNRCMYYIEALCGHCDCIAAQREVRRQQDPER
jgi:hypothetical protein